VAIVNIDRAKRLACSQVRERIEYIHPYLAPSGVTGTPVDGVRAARAAVRFVRRSGREFPRTAPTNWSLARRHRRGRVSGLAA